MTNPVSDSPALTRSQVTVRQGDALRVLRDLPDSSVDAVVCDPPYAIRAVVDPADAHRSTRLGSDCRLCPDRVATRGFDICEACLDELRIGAFDGAAMLGQQSTNWHEKATHSRGYADNDNTAFELWVTLWAAQCLRVLRPGGHLVAFGGTRTWHRLVCGAEDVGFEVRDSLAWLYATGVPKSLDVGRAVAGLDRNGYPDAIELEQAPRRRPLTDTDAAAAGWYTGVKPAHEPIVLARKPAMGTVAANFVHFGTGALNVAATRLADGRWPTNVYVDSHQADQLDRALSARGSRAFFVAKPNQSERVRIDGVSHPTVKPLALMRELVRLVTPAGGVVLDPFAGSGTTAEACVVEGRDCIAIERDPRYIRLIERRLERASTATASLRVEGHAPEHACATGTLF